MQQSLTAEQTAFARPVYTHLLNAYLAGVPETATTDMADAQVNFDCWMNDIEEGKNAARAQVASPWRLPMRCDPVHCGVAGAATGWKHRPRRRRSARSMA